MKLAKYMLLVALLVVPFASQLHAQTLVAAVAGSSALWLESGQGAAHALGCNWTDSSSSTSGHNYVTDVRSGAGSAQDFGKVWVAWTNTGSCSSPTAAAQVYLYISLDSGIGNRCLFAVPACTFTETDVAGTAGAGKLTGFTDTALPQGILNAIYPPNAANTSPGPAVSISVAGTDITPYDSLFSAWQALAPCGALNSGTQFQGYGRGAAGGGTNWPGPGVKVEAQDTTAPFNVLGWAITGTDPFTGSAAAGGYTITPVGATPVVVFVNTGNSAGFGSGAVTNADRAVLGLAFGGIFARTVDFLPQIYSSTGGGALTVWHRESLSGTYNTFDRAINNNKELYRVQEQVCPPVEPLSYGKTVDGFTSNNYRAIGTGDMVSQVESTNDSIGYAFWSAGNFSSATYGLGSSGTLMYLTVDGVDPLCSTYGCGGSPGQIPTTSAELAAVNLNNVNNGSYPIWSELRFASITAAATTAAQTLAGYAQSYVSTTQPDFITAPNLNVIHAHFGPLSGVTDAYTPSQGPRACGASSGTIEAGGDAGGIVTSLQAASDFAVLKGNYGTSSCVGITNAASFGVHN